MKVQFNKKTSIKYYCKDCGTKITYQSALYGNRRCRSCSNKISLIKRLKKGIQYHPTYKDGRSLKKHPCEYCGKLIHWQSIRCQLCYWIYLLPKIFCGEKHPNWQGGKSFELYSLEWTNQLREQIRKRDKHICQLCGKKQKNDKRILDIHHIDYIKQNCTEKNLIALCRKCNIKVNTNRDYWYAYFTYIMENK